MITSRPSPRLSLLLSLLLFVPALSAAPPWTERLESIPACLDRLQEDGDFDRARAELQAIFDDVIACADVKDKAAFRDAAAALRLGARRTSPGPGAAADLSDAAGERNGEGGEGCWKS